MSRLSMIDTTDGGGCIDNCGTILSGDNHFRKQDRIMRKYIHDPSTSVNQESSILSGGMMSRPTGNTPLQIPGSVGHNLAYSYGKR